MSVQLFIWEIPKRNIPLAILKMATNHIYLRRTKSITFYKLLGTGRGETFTLNDANLQSWALLVVGSDQRSSGIVKRWRNISSHERYYELSPISAHGSWNRFLRHHIAKSFEHLLRPSDWFRVLA